MPARTCRDRSARPCSVGAGGTFDPSLPGQRPTSAAYRSAARLMTSDSWALIGSPPVTRRCARPPLERSTASITNRISFTVPASVIITFSGSRRPWATPLRCAVAIASATSLTTQAARRGDRGPSASIRSSETPYPHSLTTYTTPSSAAASRTRSRWPSLTSADVRAAVRRESARASVSGSTCTATLRARVWSVARQKRAPPCSSRRSSSANRPARRVPGPNGVSAITLLAHLLRGWIPGAGFLGLIPRPRLLAMPEPCYGRRSAAQSPGDEPQHARDLRDPQGAGQRYEHRDVDKNGHGDGSDRLSLAGSRHRSGLPDLLEAELDRPGDGHRDSRGDHEPDQEADHRRRVEPAENVP